MKHQNMRAIIAETDHYIRSELQKLLLGEGYDVLDDEVTDGMDAVKVCSMKKPDLIIMDCSLPLLDGLSAARMIKDENPFRVLVFLTGAKKAELMRDAAQSDVDGFLFKPIDEKLLLFYLELAEKKNRRMMELKGQLEDAKRQLQERRVIEQAKGKLMEKNGWSERESYTYIRELGKDKNMSMIRISEMLLL